METKFWMGTIFFTFLYSCVLIKSYNIHSILFFMLAVIISFVCGMLNAACIIALAGYGGRG